MVVEDNLHVLTPQLEPLNECIRKTYPNISSSTNTRQKLCPAAQQSPVSDLAAATVGYRRDDRLAEDDFGS